MSDRLWSFDFERICRSGLSAQERAILINPYDVEATADALYYSIFMKKKKESHEADASLLENETFTGGSIIFCGQRREKSLRIS